MQESPVVTPLQIDEGIAVVTEPEPPFPTTSLSALRDAQKSDGEGETSTERVNLNLNEKPTEAMEVSVPDVGREFLEEFISTETSHVISPQFSQFVPPTAHSDLGQLIGTEQYIHPDISRWTFNLMSK